MQHIQQYLTDLKNTLDALDPAQIVAVRERIAAVRERGGQLFLCGNGGSAATASHLANDLGKGASYGREGARFRVIALTDNIPWMTALANDVGYEVIFAEQLRNLAQPGDVLLAISGSGNSPNILQAVEAAREIGVEVIGWTGFGGGKLAGMSDLAIVADSHHMGRVEDVHTILMHLVCYYFMEMDES